VIQNSLGVAPLAQHALVLLRSIGVARIFSGSALFSSKMFTTFLVVVLETQTKTANLTTLMLSISPAPGKI